MIVFHFFVSVLAGLVSLLFCAAVLAVTAKNRGRNAGGWFFYALYLLPVAFVHLLTLEKLKTCPECGERVKAAARTCKHCQSALEA